MFFIPVQGTNGLPDQPAREWWYAGGERLAAASPFVRFMAAQGWHLVNAADQYVWSTDVNGLVRYLPGGGKRDWRVGGDALRWYIADQADVVRDRPLVLLAHSHGLQVVLEALADPLAPQVAGVISVGSPIRGDMRDVARAARPRMGYWLHLHAKLDFWQRLGQLFDRDVNMRGSWPKGYPTPDHIVELPGAGLTVHGELLRNEQHFPHWVDRGWLRTLEAAAAAA